MEQSSIFKQVEAYKTQEDIREEKRKKVEIKRNSVMWKIIDFSQWLWPKIIKQNEMEKKERSEFEN